MLQSEQDEAIKDLQERVEQLSVLKWTPGDVIVANLGVAGVMTAEGVREQLRDALGEDLEVVVFHVFGSDVKLSVITHPMGGKKRIFVPIGTEVTVEAPGDE